MAKKQMFCKKMLTLVRVSAIPIYLVQELSEREFGMYQRKMLKIYLGASQPAKRKMIENILSDG
ncbi:MAG: hypothetical protein GY820_06160 [Gammaproteobacteria bacterium]|nr:hypothetical protein [Gammaproteobacteria bacterium]